MDSMSKAARFRLTKRARKNPVAVNLVKEVVDLGAEDAKDTNLLQLPHQTEICCGGVARRLKSGAKLGKLWIANSLLLRVTRSGSMQKSVAGEQFVLQGLHRYSKYSS